MASWLYNPTSYNPRRPVETFGPDLMPRSGVVLLVAPSNVGKSTWITSMLHTWDTTDGTRINEDIMAPEGGAPRSWYFAFEDGDNMRNTYAGFGASYTERLNPDDPSWEFRRLQSGAYGYRRWVDSVLFTPPSDALDLTDADSVEAFLDTVETEADPILAGGGYWPEIVVIDNYSLCIGQSDENEAATPRKALRGVERIKDFLGASLVVLVCHARSGDTKPRGSEVLFNHAQGVVHLSGMGEIVTATNTKLKGAERGAKRRYRRTVMEGPMTTYLEYVDITNEDVKPACPAPAPQTPAKAVEATVTAPKAPPAPKAPVHPADALRGLNAVAWTALSLQPGQTMSLAEAENRVTAHPCFDGVDRRRRRSRFQQVQKAWSARGLVNTQQGLVTNPA